MKNERDFPKLTRNEDKFFVDFGPAGELGENSVDIPLVLDLDRFDNVIGIEALNFASYAGSQALADIDPSYLDSAGLRLSYDDGVDALYLRIEEGRSRAQRPVNGKVILDADGRLLRLETNLV